jgi:hypothetical protein
MAIFILSHICCPPFCIHIFAASNKHCALSLVSLFISLFNFLGSHSQANKESQKGIIIGKGGAGIKALGIAAREKLEEVSE